MVMSSSSPVSSHEVEKKEAPLLLIDISVDEDVAETCQNNKKSIPMSISDNISVMFEEDPAAPKSDEILKTPKQRGDFGMGCSIILSSQSASKSKRKGGRKRKRKTKNLSTPSCLPTKKSSPKMANVKKNKRNKRNSVIVIESDSEPDVSVIEIDDESQSTIVVSDDEVGVCSGSVSSISFIKKPLKPFNQNPSCVRKKPKPTALAVEDFTGTYIVKKTAQFNKRVEKRDIGLGEGSASEVPVENQPDSQNKNFELYQPLADPSKKKTGLRPIVIDGSNVAFGHGRDRFSSVGLKICIDYFKKMGHEVRAFVPQFRKFHSSTTEPQILEELEKEGTVVFTPSRRTDGKMIVSYDDRFIVQYADANGGIVVSRDNFRDLLTQNPEWRDTINKRLLMFTWVGDAIMFPNDPLGRGGPALQDFLRF